MVADIVSQNLEGGLPLILSLRSGYSQLKSYQRLIFNLKVSLCLSLSQKRLSGAVIRQSSLIQVHLFVGTRHFVPIGKVLRILVIELRFKKLIYFRISSWRYCPTRSIVHHFSSFVSSESDFFVVDVVLAFVDHFMPNLFKFFKN